MSFLSSLTVMLGADVATFESDMGKAVRVAEQKTKQIERQAKGTGKAIGEIGHALNTVNFGGLDKISASSKVATGAVKGLGAAISLIGYASWPTMAIVAAAGAVAYFAGAAGEADRESEALAERLDKLAMSAEQLAMAPLQADLVGAAAERFKIEDRLASQNARLNDPKMHPAHKAQLLASETYKQMEADLERWKAREKAAYDAILKVRSDFAARAAKEAQAAAGKDGVFTMDTMVVKPGAALQAELDNIKLARKLAEEAKTPFEELGEALAVIDQALTARDLQGNPLLSAEAAERLKAARLDEYYKDIAKAANQMGPPLLETGDIVEDGTGKWSVFADEAARSMNTIVAGLLRGKGASENFFASVLDGLADVASQLAASKLLESFFGGFIKDAGFLGDFARAVIPGKAGGGSAGAGGLFEVNEHRPEMLSVGDRDFLLMGSKSGRIDPNPGARAGGGLVFAPVINIAQGLNGSQVFQAAQRALADARRELVRDLSRSKLVSVT